MGKKIYFSKRFVKDQIKNNKKIRDNTTLMIHIKDKYPDLYNSHLRIKRKKQKVAKYLIENPPSRYETEKIIRKYKNRSHFSKSSIMYSFSEQYYPGLLDSIYPKIPTWQNMSFSKRELIKKLKSFKNRTIVMRKQGQLHRYCIHKYPGLFDKVFPLKYYVFGNKSKNQIKKEIISKMKKSGLRSQFKWNYPSHYNYMKKLFPNLIDQYLPPLESKTQSLGEKTSRYFLERVLNAKFPNTRPKWLINDLTNKEMELDGLCLRLNIAFEYGDHTQIRNRKGKDIRAILAKDELKKKICLKKRIKLIQINTDIFSTNNPEESLKTQLIKEFKRLKIKGLFKIKKTKFIIVYPRGFKYTKDMLWKEADKYNNPRSFLGQKKYGKATYRIGEYKAISIFLKNKAKKLASKHV